MDLKSYYIHARILLLIKKTNFSLMKSMNQIDVMHGNGRTIEK